MLNAAPTTALGWKINWRSPDELPYENFPLRTKMKKKITLPTQTSEALRLGGFSFFTGAGLLELAFKHSSF